MKHIGTLAIILCEEQSACASRKHSQATHSVRFIRANMPYEESSSESECDIRHFTEQAPQAFSYAGCRDNEMTGSKSTGDELTLAEALALDPGGI